MAKSETLQKVNALIKGVPLKEIIETAETVASIIPIPGLKIVIKILKVLLIATPTASSVLTKSAQTVKQREDANKEAFDRMWSIACTDNHITEDEETILWQAAEKAGIEEGEFKLMVLSINNQKQ